MSAWDGEPIKLLVKRTATAARDFADWRVSEKQQDQIAENLRSLPISRTDTFDKSGLIRFRKVDENFEIAFQIASTPDAYLVLVIGYDKVGEMQSWLSIIHDVAVDSSPAIVKAAAITVIEGRRRKREL